MNTEKRKFGDYEVIHSITLGKTEMIVGECDYKEPRYVCCDIQHTNLLQLPQNDVYERSYLKIMREFSNRISDRVTELEKEAPQAEKVITAEQCMSVNDFNNIAGMVVVVSPKSLKREYQNERNQLYYAVSGNGTKINSMGNAVFCYNLATKEHTRWERYDLLGVIKKDEMPEWAKEGLSEIKKMIADRSREEAR